MMPTTLPAASRRTYRHPRVIVALDYPDEASALALAEQLNPLSCAVKVGNELFVAAGPFVVSALIERGFDVFLDLKFHDIPNTAAQACKAATRLGAWMMNVHASGGRAMLEAARAAVDQAAKEAGCERPLLIAVTVLTSLDDAALEDVSTGSSVPPTIRQRCVASSATTSCSSRPAFVPREPQPTIRRASRRPKRPSATVPTTW